MQNLSDKTMLVYEYVCKCISRGVPPSVREICRELNIKSTSTAHKCLNQLAEAGLIDKGDRLNRAITLPNFKSSIRVPLLGTVTAGQPILAVEEIEDYLPFSDLGYSSSELFALRVKGESMINAGILDGDIIVVHKTDFCRNGQIVVAMINDEATVKRFYKENGHYRLQPENDTMAPIYCDSVTILGKVIALYREFD